VSELEPGVDALLGKEKNPLVYPTSYNVLRELPGQKKQERRG